MINRQRPDAADRDGLRRGFLRQNTLDELQTQKGKLGVELQKLKARAHLPPALPWHRGVRERLHVSVGPGSFPPSPNPSPPPIPQPHHGRPTGPAPDSVQWCAVRHARGHCVWYARCEWG